MDNNKLAELLNEASDFIAQKDFEDALEILNKAREIEPDNLEVLKMSGLVLVNLENFVEAKKTFETLTKLDSSDATSWYYLASAEEKLEDFTAAIESYNKVLGLRPEYIDAYKALGILYLKTGQTEILISTLEKALEYAKDDYQIYYIISSAYMTSKDNDKAVEYLKKAHELNPEHLQIMNNIGSCYIAKGEYDNAFEYLEKAYKLEPQNSLTNFNLGSIYQIKEDFNKAYKYFNTAYIKEPSTTNLSSLALCAMQADKWDVAKTLYKSLCAIRPEKNTYKTNYLNCCIQTGNYTEGLDIAMKLAKLNPKSVDIQKKLAYLLRVTKHPQNAIEILEKLVKRGKIDYEVYYNLAIANINIEDFENGKEYLKKCLVLEPENPVGRRDLGILYMRMNYIDWAEDEFKTVIEYEPNNPENHFNYALCLNKSQAFEQADVSYKKAIELDGGNSKYHTYYGENLLTQEKEEEAREELELAVKLNPENVKARFALAKIYFKNKKYKVSHDLLVDISGAPNNAEILNMLAQCSMKLKNFEEAENILHTIHHSFPENHLVLCDLAKCRLELKQYDKAKEAASKALMIFPDFEDAIKILKQIQNNEE